MKTKKNQTTVSSTIPATDHWQTGIVGLFNLLLLTVPLFFSFNTEELFEFNKMLLVYFLSICIGVVWAIRMTIHRKIIFKTTRLDIPILAFLLSQLLSTVFSIHPYTSLLGYYTRFHGGLISTICYIGLYYAFVSNVEKKHLKGLCITLMAGVGITSIYAILEHFGHSFSCYLVTQGQSFGTDCWVQDVKNRVFSTFGQPNWLAAYLITLLPLFMSCSISSKRKWAQSAAILISVITFITVLYTRSRSGILGLAVGVGLYFVLFLWAVFRKKTATISQAARTFWPAMVLVVTFGILFLTIDNPFSAVLNRFWVTKQTEQVVVTPTPAADAAPAPVVNRLEVGGSDSADIRKIVWTGAIRVWQRYPIFGSGVETFAYSYYQDRPLEHNLVSEWDFLYNKAHNEFLNFLATTGLVGFLSYCALLVTFGYLTFRRYLTAVKNEEMKHALIFSSLLSGVLALSISNFFGFSTVAVTVIMYLFFALPEVLTAPPTPQTIPPKETVSWQNTAFVVIGIIGLVLLYRLFNYWTADIDYTTSKKYLAQGNLNEGFGLLNTAIRKTPEESLFYDTLSTEYATYAIEFAKIGQATDSAQLAQHAISTQNMVMQLNPRNINYYKTRAQIFITLSQLEPKNLEEAKKALESARTLAPTDPKLVYNLALIELGLGQAEQGITHLQETVALKPNYEAARMQLAQNLEEQHKPAEALAQYQYIVENITPDSTVAQQKIASLSAQLKK